MAGTHLTIDIDDAALRRALAGLIERIQQPRDAMAEIGEVLTESTKQRFSDQRGPDGTPWAPNTEVTRARKKNPNILTEGGYLGDLIRYQLTDGGRGVEVGSDRVYAAVQQLGQPRGASGTTKRGAPIPWGDILANIALVGAVVGGSAAAAQNALRLNRDEIELREALLSTGRTAIASAAATAVASAVAGAVAKQGVLRLSVMFGVGAAMLYGFNHWIDGEGEADE